MTSTVGFSSERCPRTARAGAAMPFAITVDGEFAGQVTVSNIVRGSAQFASIGYWIDPDYAGRGVVPLAVALVIDHCFFSAGLHRIEISIRPENANSLRVVEKLGIAEATVTQRAQKACAKLGAKTRTQAVAIAVARNYL